MHALALLTDSPINSPGELKSFIHVCQGLQPTVQFKNPTFVYQNIFKKVEKSGL